MQSKTPDDDPKIGRALVAWFLQAAGICVALVVTVGVLVRVIAEIVEMIFGR